MTTQEPPPMSPALRALIEADNQRPGPSDRVRTGGYAALGVSLGVVPAGAIVAAHAATASTATSATATATTTVGALSTMGRLALLAKAPLVGVGLGAVLGATVMAYVVKKPVASRPSAEKPTVAVVTHARATALEAAPDDRPVGSEPAPVLARRAVASSTAALPHRLAPELRGASPASNPETSDQRLPAQKPEPSAHAPGALAAEQALLDPARVALAHGDGAEALARLDAHERRFPGGALSQEREAMAIHALVLTGDHARAQMRADSFRSRYPDSVLWPMIDAALRSRP